MSNQRLTISLSNLFLLAALGSSLILLWQLKNLIVVLMIAVVIAATLAPIIQTADKTQRSSLASCNFGLSQFNCHSNRNCFNYRPYRNSTNSKFCE